MAVEPTQPPESSRPQTGKEHAHSYLNGTIPESVHCTLNRNLFTYCSYSSKYIGTGPRWFTKDLGIRCVKCNWVFCAKSVDEETGICQVCKDYEIWKSLKDPKITLVHSVIVVGTGMGGLAAALALKNRGVEKIMVIERSPALRTNGGPIIVQTNAMRALLEIDSNVMIQILDKAGPLNDLGAFKSLADNRTLFASNLSTTKESRWGNPEGRSVVRGILTQMLYEECVKQGIEFEFGWTVRNVIENEDDNDSLGTMVGVVATRTETTAKEGENASDKGESTIERTWEGDFIVAADGIWSKVRQQIFPQAQMPQFVGYHIFYSVAPKDAFDQMSVDCWGEVWGTGHRFGFFRCGEGGTAMYFSRTSKDETQDEQASPEELKQVMVDALKEHGYPLTLQELAQAAEVTRMYRYPIRWMPLLQHHVSQKSGRILLLGDAANGMPPNLGQGGGMALESACVLSQVLLTSTTLKEAMKKYEVRRIERCSLIAKESKSSGDLFQASHWFTAWLRNTLFSYLGSQTNKTTLSLQEELDLPDPFAYLFSYRIMSYYSKNDAEEHEDS